ncbi:conserved hypothetical protein [Histoplasma capsulatum var. duboisii H88]|uniref:PH domain-containing protein n=1 Tax=Ajellomyces capsulatus (strain H88) TaxID=544711 RepID=F0UP39_AJEC8|nr:conserved hypothetical protein [Histoplasma capsulatum var. duboisii H88]
MDSRSFLPSSSSTSSASIRSPQQQAPPKYSRYRAVRKAAETKTIQNGDAAAQPFPTTSRTAKFPSSSPSFSETQNESIKRSMSRYRHAKPGGATRAVHSVPPPPPFPAAVALPTRPHTQGDCMQDPHEGERSEAAMKQHRTRRAPRQDHPGTARTSYTSSVPGAAQSAGQSNSGNGLSGVRVVPVDNDMEDAKSPPEYSPLETDSGSSSMEESGNRRSRANAHSSSSESHSTPTTSKLRTIVGARMLDIRDQVENITNEELAANERATAALNGSKLRPLKVKPKSSGFLSRMKALNPTSSSKLNNNGNGDSHYRNDREKLKTLISSPQPIAQDKVKVDVGSEVPISAVNAGTRKVLVTCNDSLISLPITPSTQAQDLLNSAAYSLSENIDPQSSILLESFKQLGLERPLRRYEHVRDVMNSWDCDAQNHLIVSRLPDMREREGLDIKLAPRKQPSESEFHLYHSQRHGKWEKRWVTLRSDGQVSVAKKQGGEPTNICHLSDFDIYSPTSRETAKRVKAPKGIVFAIKSQQKLNMFVTTENYVHYFATNDEQTGLEWYKAVQQWRSWYLVNVLCESDKTEKASVNSNPKPTRTGAQNTMSNGRQNSDDSTPYQLGSFKPLLDMDMSAWKIEPVRNTPEGDEPSKSKTVSSPGRSMHTQKRPFTSAGKPKKEPINASSPDPFTSTGLLGKTYSERKKALEERENDTPQYGFTGLGLLRNVAAENSTRPAIASSNRSSRRSSRDCAAPPNPTSPTSPNGSASSSFSRSKSIKQKPKPLIDLTPVYQEPPQHARRGRGVPAGPGKPLVEAATSPEVLPGAIIVPSATTWRKPQAQPSQLPTSPDIAHPNPSRGAGGGSAHPNRPTTSSHTPSIGPLERAATFHNSNINEHTPPMPLPETPQAQAHGSPFAPTGLLARAATISAARSGARPDTGRGVATGDRNNFKKPMLDISQDSQFAEGSLLRGAEVDKVGKGAKVPVAVPVIDRG